MYDNDNCVVIIQMVVKILIHFFKNSKKCIATFSQGGWL
jgi:hypothetical protein